MLPSMQRSKGSLNLRVPVAKHMEGDSMPPLDKYQGVDPLIFGDLTDFLTETLQKVKKSGDTPESKRSALSQILSKTYEASKGLHCKRFFEIIKLCGTLFEDKISVAVPRFDNSQKYEIMRAIAHFFFINQRPEKFSIETPNVRNLLVQLKDLLPMSHSDENPAWEQEGFQAIIDYLDENRIMHPEFMAFAFDFVNELFTFTFTQVCYKKKFFLEICNLPNNVNFMMGEAVKHLAPNMTMHFNSVETKMVMRLLMDPSINFTSFRRYASLLFPKCENLELQVSTVLDKAMANNGMSVENLLDVFHFFILGTPEEEPARSQFWSKYQSEIILILSREYPLADSNYQNDESISGPKWSCIKKGMTDLFKWYSESVLPTQSMYNKNHYANILTTQMLLLVTGLQTMSLPEATGFLLELKPLVAVAGSTMPVRCFVSDLIYNIVLLEGLIPGADERSLEKFFDTVRAIFNPSLEWQKGWFDFTLNVLAEKNENAFNNAYRMVSHFSYLIQDRTSYEARNSSLEAFWSEFALYLCNSKKGGIPHKFKRELILKILARDPLIWAEPPVTKKTFTTSQAYYYTSLLNSDTISMETAIRLIEALLIQFDCGALLHRLVEGLLHIASNENSISYDHLFRLATWLKQPDIAADRKDFLEKNKALIFNLICKPFTHVQSMMVTGVSRKRRVVENPAQVASHYVANLNSLLHKLNKELNGDNSIFMQNLMLNWVAIACLEMRALEAAVAVVKKKPNNGEPSFQIKRDKELMLYAGVKEDVLCIIQSCCNVFLDIAEELDNSYLTYQEYARNKNWLHQILLSLLVKGNFTNSPKEGFICQGNDPNDKRIYLMKNGQTNILWVP